MARGDQISCYLDRMTLRTRSEIHCRGPSRVAEKFTASVQIARKICVINRSRRSASGSCGQPTFENGVGPIEELH